MHPKNNRRFSYDHTDDYIQAVVCVQAGQLFTSSHAKGGFDRTPQTPLATGMPFPSSLPSPILLIGK